MILTAAWLTRRCRLPWTARATRSTCRRRTRRRSARASCATSRLVDVKAYSVRHLAGEPRRQPPTARRPSVTLTWRSCGSGPAPTGWPCRRGVGSRRRSSTSTRRPEGADHRRSPTRLCAITGRSYRIARVTDFGSGTVIGSASITGIRLGRRTNRKLWASGRGWSCRRRRRARRPRHEVSRLGGRWPAAHIDTMRETDEVAARRLTHPRKSRLPVLPDGTMRETR